jgi:hypothetical protein
MKAGRKTMRKTVSIGLVVVFFCLFAFPQDQQDQKRAPSTPEERKRFFALVHKLEKTPLDTSLNSEAAWALQWLDDIPDVTVNMCFDPLGHFDAEEYRYDSRIRGLFVLGMGVYLLEHPQKAADNTAIYLAGVESALKAYRSILKTKPEAKSRALDELVAKEDEGLLADYVRDASKGCDDTNQT